MDEQTKSKIEMFGRKIRKFCVRETHEKYGEMYGHDGHSWTDAPDIIKYEANRYKYAYTWKERRKAKKELRRMRKNSLDEEVINAIDEQFKMTEDVLRKEKSDPENLKRLAIINNDGVQQWITCGVLFGATVLTIGGCVLYYYRTTH